MVLTKEKSPSQRHVTVTETLPSATVTIGKALSLSSVFFTGPRQRSTPWAPLSPWHSAKVAWLPSLTATTLGKKVLPVPRCAYFAECYTLGKVIRIPFHLFTIPSKQTKDISHNHHIYITYIKNHHIHQTHDIAHKDHMFLHKDHKVTSTTK